MQRKKPLYRRVNTRTHSVRHGEGGNARWDRNTKAGISAAMKSHHRHGLDYTPLFRFLLSKVGQPFDAVQSEAIARLDKPDPIFWMVAQSELDRRAMIRIGNSSYYSGLYVDGSGLLAKVDPDLSAEALAPFCACCTHTFNGERFGLPFDPD